MNEAERIQILELAGRYYEEADVCAEAGAFTLPA